MVEKPPKGTAPSNLSITGRYILQPEIFRILETQERGAGGEIQLTDAMIGLAKTQKFYGVEFEGERHDCGSKAGFLRANIAFGMARADLRDGLRAEMKVSGEVGISRHACDTIRRREATSERLRRAARLSEKADAARIRAELRTDRGDHRRRLPRAAHRASWWETLRSPQEKMPQREACLAGGYIATRLADGKSVRFARMPTPGRRESAKS